MVGSDQQRTILARRPGLADPDAEPRQREPVPPDRQTAGQRPVKSIRQHLNG